MFDRCILDATLFSMSTDCHHPLCAFSGTWLGVEWDDASRGKHDGSKDGVRYFETKYLLTSSLSSKIFGRTAESGVACMPSLLYRCHFHHYRRKWIPDTHPPTLHGWHDLDADKHSCFVSSS